MGRFLAAAQVAAFFLITGSLSPQARAQACEDCDQRATGSPPLPDVGRLDVTVAVESASSFVIDALRSLRLFSRLGLAPGQVDIIQQPFDGSGSVAIYNNVIVSAGDRSVAATVAEYVAAYTSDEPVGEAELPGFRRKYLWQLTYRSDAPGAMSAQPAQSERERFPGMNTTLDDSWVVGLRFAMDYGWTR